MPSRVVAPDPVKLRGTGRNKPPIAARVSAVTCALDLQSRVASAVIGCRLREWGGGRRGGACDHHRRHPPQYNCSPSVRLCSMRSTSRTCSLRAAEGAAPRVSTGLQDDKDIRLSAGCAPGEAVITGGNYESNMVRTGSRSQARLHRDGSGSPPPSLGTVPDRRSPRSAARWRPGDCPSRCFPTVDFPRVAVTVEAGDQPVDRMVVQVTRPLEQSCARCPGGCGNRSTSSRGSAELSLNFDWGADMVAAQLQVESAVNAVVADLPTGTRFLGAAHGPDRVSGVGLTLTSKTHHPRACAT